MTTYHVTNFKIGENTGVISIGNTLNFKTFCTASAIVEADNG